MTTPNLVTAVEVQRPWTRLTPMRKTGTLRFDGGHVAFETSDGRRHVSVPLEGVTELVRHRGGFGFWVRFDGRRYFVTPRARPRPGGFNPLYALLRPLSTGRYIWWSARDRRRARALTRRWLEILARYDPASGGPHPATGDARGLPGVIRIPLRAALTGSVVLGGYVAAILPVIEILSQPA
jgi:hypothetical protein